MTDRYQFIPEFHFPKSAHQLTIQFLPLQKFLDDALKMPEVWFVTNWQAVQWMREPKTLNELKSFAPWSCKKQVSLSTYCQKYKPFYLFTRGYSVMGYFSAPADYVLARVKRRYDTQTGFHHKYSVKRKTWFFCESSREQNETPSFVPGNIEIILQTEHGGSQPNTLKRAMFT